MELLDDVAGNASRISHQQEHLALLANSAAADARNLSAIALQNLCQAIEIYNVTTDLVHQLDSQDAANVRILQQEIQALIISIQETISEHDVFNISRQLIDKAANISVPLYDVELLDILVHNVIQNATELVTNANKSLIRLTELEKLAGNVTSTAEELFRMRRQLEEESNELLITLNESFFWANQSINMAHSYIDNVTWLDTNLTMISQSFNKSFTDVVKELEQAENITKAAHNLSINGEEHLERIHQVLGDTEESLQQSSSQLSILNDTLDSVSCVHFV